MAFDLQNSGLPLFFSYSLLLLASFWKKPIAKDTTMKMIARFFSTLLTQQSNASNACSLLEQAANARGLSQGDAAQLRINAIALLSVVR